jgi:hypothetical protein
LGIYLDCLTVVAGLKTDFLDYFEENWLDMNHLGILSFHSSAGVVIGNATIPNNTAILKPVADGPVGICSPSDL